MKLPVVTTDKPWYANGLDFTCTTCGNCCTGGPGYVWVTDDEIAAAAGHLGLPLADFRKKFCRKIGQKVSFKEVRQPGGLHDCIFLKELPAPHTDRQLEPGEPIPQSRRVCSIYKVRPLQCRTWPFWPENLVTKSAWKRAAKGCPGMDRPGRRFDRKRIEELRDGTEWPKDPPTSDQPETLG